MAGDVWVERPFEEVIDFREGPGILAKDFREDGIPLVRLAGLDRGASVLEGCNYLDPDAVKTRWAHFQLALGDVLLSTSASLGRIAVVGQEGIGAIPYTGIIRMRPRDESLHPPFIQYLLEGPDFQRQAEMVGVGSVIRHFGPMHLRQMTVTVPPLPEQRTIAYILGTLDNKIELNRRMNDTLEAMARALFKSWFVDFDPVRAKAALRNHAALEETSAIQGGGDWNVGRAHAYLDSMDPEIAALFPDSFVDSELGEIPAGWKVGVLGDVLRQRVERCRASEETVLFPYVPIDCISPRSLSLTESKAGAEAKSSLTKFYAGDLLFGAMRPYYHKVCIAPFDGTTRTTAFVLHPKREGDFSFAALLLHDAATIDFATRNSTGSTIPYAVWNGSLEEMTITLPASCVLNAFDETLSANMTETPGPL